MIIYDHNDTDSIKFKYQNIEMNPKIYSWQKLILEQKGQ